ncbi:MAG: hypothetical protein ACFFD4_39940 [Candidatus Odinarchaeota archaeon]
MANCIAGVCSVLLSPNRPAGDWWNEPKAAHTKRANVNGDYYVTWAGCENWFLQHPATVSLISGFLRQSRQLVNDGFGKQILDSVDQGEVEEVLTTGHRGKALRLAKQLRPWIEVPPATGMSTANYAIPMGSWRKLIRLQRAVHKHGYEKVLDQGFAKRWNLMEDKINVDWNGADSFWASGNQNYERLMTLGAPGKKRSMHGKK